MDSKLLDEWREADRLFQQLIEMDEPARSEAFADCGASTLVRAKLESMLLASQRKNKFLDNAGADLPWPTFPSADGDKSYDDPLPGRQIGDWKLIELIGYGGMSTVYRGERVGHDYAQSAAIKLLGVALRGPAEQARFRREQRILAQLQHPHIASLIDAGVGDDGTPYLAMSLIAGERIDRHCDRQNLGITERVELMLQVCAAVTYAHRQLIIHRDIKPGNILVDGNGHATLLDFGIARLLDADSTGEATVTRAFTPDYASPEQRSGDQTLGTPVDIYGLAAVLHRLLAGAAPQHDVHGDPVRASAVARESGTLKNVSALRGDLDAILSQALATDPQRRYVSVDALASDLHAWLEHRPLQARRANGWTRATKFLHRNRIVCGLAILAMLASAAGLTTYVASNYAERQYAEELQAVATFQSDMLQKIAPQEVGAKLHDALSSALQKYAPSDATVTSAVARIDYTGMAVDMLDEALLKRAVNTVRKDFADQPRVKAMLLQTLANSYRDLDMLDAAEPIQEQATVLFHNALGASDPQTLASMRDQLQLLRARALGSAPVDGEARHRELLRAHIRYLGEDSVDTALAREALGQWLMSHGKAVEAEELIRAAAASIEHGNGHDDPDAVAARANLAYAIDAQGRYAEAVPWYRQSIADMSAVYGPEHRDTLVQEGNLAYVLDKLGRTAEAEELLRKVYEANRNRLGDDHLLTVNSLNNLAVTMGRTGDLASAEPIQKRAFADSRRVLGADHAITLSAQMNLAHVYFKLGRFDDARVLLTDAIDRWKPHNDRMAIIECQRQLGKTLQALGQPAPALQALTESWEIATEIKSQDQQRKTAQALLAFHGDPDGDPKQREHWEEELRKLGREPILPSR